MITIKQLASSDLVDEASALLYKVYIEQMKWQFSPNNPSQLRIETHNNRHLLVDRFTSKAIWFGVFDDNQLISCARLCGVDENYQLELEGYSSSQPVFQRISQEEKKSCFEITKVATHPDYMGKGIIKLLFLALFNYCEETQHSAIACTNNGYLKALFKKIELPLKIESAFKYEPQDPTPVNFYFADYQKGEVKEVRKILEYLENDLSNNTNKIFKALEMVEPILPTPFYWMDKNGVVLGINELCLKEIGTTREIIGKKPYAFYKKEIADHILQHNAEVIKREEILSQEEWIEDVTTKEIKCFSSIKAPLYDDDGQVIGIVGSSTNITKEKEAEKQLREAKELAERMTQAKSNFLATMSHELRTPLNGILGMTQVLMSKNPTPEQQEYINAIEESGKNLLALINNVLDFSKLEAGQVELHQDEFSPVKVVKDLVLVMQHVIQDKTIELHAEYAANLPKFVAGDLTRLRQILINLIGNAIKFTLEGQVTIKLNLVSEIDRIAKIEIIVEDTGIGIPADKINTIFDRFTQVESEYSRRFEGSGLGLAIVKNLVEMMNGTIDVESELGKGSKFICILPFIKIEQDQVKSDANLIKQLQSFDKSTQFNAYVLVVEDNPINQTVMRAMLTSLGCAVDVASNGQEAVKQFEQHEYDLIFMDIGLPDMDGLQVTKSLLAIKKKLKRPAIPIVALTAHVMEDDRKNCLKAGMTDMLTKPIVHAQLVELLKRLIKPSTQDFKTISS